MSQTVLGKAVGVTFQQIQKYERGTNRISSGRLQQFADILNVDIPYFFDGAPGQRKIIGKVPGTDHITEFIQNDDAKKLMRSFMKIEDKNMRRLIARLVDRLAQ
jgi:transcriptional regulator with XRE-family HTH domain